VANCVIFHTTLDMMAVFRQLIAEGWVIGPDDLATMSPYLTGRIKRLGEYATDGPSDPPEAFDPHLELVRAAAEIGEAPNGGEAA